ncbi:hypothetical protein RhiirA5_430903 [Rhizophagus irregularis]|uniref:Uncharacterized protein n=1 Tax=Rhizophagus irregularis TaxID=588596 RepID=A0A2N0NVW8_9GLOM|nr:hypothetical protein RhiirA5_430903 [Rhizophagus irregularis]
MVCDSGDEMEIDEEEARTILKTFPIELELIYDEKFSIKSWLAALHKHRKVRLLLYKQHSTLDKDNRHLHQNNRLNEKKVCRVKDAKSLFDKNDEKLENYDRKKLLNVLNDNRYHVPEYFESDEKQPDGKRYINVYNPSWRSEELIDFLQNILDQHAFSLQSAQLIRTRNYDDEIYNIVSRHTQGASNWTYVEQNTLADTNFFELKTPIQTMENLIMAENVEVSAKMNEIEVIEDSEPMGIEESELTEESELIEVKELEPIGVKELPEMEDETDK